MIVNLFSVILIALLLGALHAVAVSNLQSLVLSSLNYVGLLTVSILIIATTSLIHTRLAKLLTSFGVFYLCVELLINQLTGLHFNFFILENIKELIWLNPISTALIIILSGTSSIVTYVAIKKQQIKIFKKSVTAPIVPLALITIASLTATQITYAYGYYHGNLDSIRTKRQLSLLITPHPYYIKQIAQLFFGEQLDNPFAISRKPAENHKVTPLPASTKNPGSQPNILLIIMDSFRSSDIIKDPSITPHISNWDSNLIFKSYDHYSTANCTHFSLYNLLTGKLPTGFSASRRNPALSKPLSLLLQNSYQFSTSEAKSLDWYDTAETIFAGHAVRHITNAPNNNDNTAIQKSIEIVQKAQQTNLPFFHITYLDGTHFPYSEQGISPDVDLIDQYHTALKIMDQNIGAYLNTLEATGVFENTIVILTSDHGEEILGNGFIGHGSRLSNEQVQVPMIILGPSKYQPKTVLPKSHSDIMPYLLNAVGIKRPTSNKGQAIILANCDYDHPNGFAVIKNKKRADFIYEDGYLYNDNTPGSNMSKDEITEATKILIKQLNQ